MSNQHKEIEDLELSGMTQFEERMIVRKSLLFGRNNAATIFTNIQGWQAIPKIFVMRLY
jgi:hypothetical protein